MSRFFRIAGLLVVLVAVSPARAAVTYVLGPGQEAAVEKLFTLTTDAAAPWRFDKADIGGERIAATYVLGDALRVAMSVVHESAVPEGVVATRGGGLATFVSALQGVPSTALLAALEDRLATNLGRDGGQLAWRTVEGAPGTPGTERAAPPDAMRFIYDARKALERADRELALSLVQKAEAQAGQLPVLDRDWLAIEAGYVRIEAGQPEQAGPQFEQALGRLQAAMAKAGDDNTSIDPDRALFLSARALAGLARDAELDAAVGKLVTARRDSGAACDLFDLGDDLARKGAVDRSIALFRRLVDAGVACPRGFGLIGKVAFRTKRLADVAPLLEKGAALYPGSEEVVMQLATYYKFIDRRADAIALLEKLLDAGGRDGDLFGDLLGLYARSPEFTSKYAKTFVEKADQHPDDPVANFFAGALLHYTHDYPKSTTYLRKAEGKLEGIPRLFLYIAMNEHRGGGSHELAKEYILKAVGAGTHDPDVFYCRGVIFMDDEPRAALADLDRYLAVTRESFDVPAHKTETVTKIVEALRRCLDAPVPSKCVDIPPP